MEIGRIGPRIAYWRERRGFTQGDFGRLMGRSRRWVQDIEGGHRQTDPRLSVLERAASVLRIPLDQLLADEPAASVGATAPPPEVRSVLDVLDRHDVVTGIFEVDSLPASTTQLRSRLVYCCEAFQACHYATLGRQLPALIVESHRAAAAAPADKTCDAQSVLSRVYQLTASFLHKYGESAMVHAALAADRALAAAERSEDPVAIGAASRRVAKSLMYQGRAETAQAFASTAARRLAEELTAGGPLGLSTLGMLYLSAAVAASGQERSSQVVRTASGLVDEAAEVASRQGGDRNEDWTMFGPTNVDLHRVDVLVRFEDGWSALDAADRLSPEAVNGLTCERKAQHLISMARAHLLTRRKEDAATVLLEAERLAPEEVVGRPTTVDLVKDVLGVTAKPTGELRALATRCGLRA
ncbi:helix-turn-helix domain-containing protein [Streptomyces sp. SAJ15]|uniref:helix-turn-helix domain-containing protein n=1 Tax=Streptomyces sp. SAJ15 TaxID=2011095 RepID=UPI001184BE04|nr:helix-turn-helix transcriptional regulator [Streptomyces sp. SAJ15]TVL91742.1 DNA-binding protein [Streptomyces sp. SAJ15]